MIAMSQLELKQSTSWLCNYYYPILMITINFTLHTLIQCFQLCNHVNCCYCWLLSYWWWFSRLILFILTLSKSNCTQLIEFLIIRILNQKTKQFHQLINSINCFLNQIFTLFLVYLARWKLCPGSSVWCGWRR